MSDGPFPSESAYRPCPACGEPIRREAVICRYCHYDFRTNSMPGPSPYGYPLTAPRTNPLAVASLVLGIVNMLVGSILALVFGYRAMREIDESHGTQTGRGLAVAGVVLGWVGLAMGLVWLAFFFVVFLPHWHDLRFGQ
jgi:hypothetical protein